MIAIFGLVGLLLALVPIQADDSSPRFRIEYGGFVMDAYPEDQLQSPEHYLDQLIERRNFAPLGLGLLGVTQATERLRNLIADGLDDTFSFHVCTGLILLGERPCLDALEAALETDIPEYPSLLEEGSWSNTTVSNAARAFRFLTANGVELPPEILEVSIDRLDHVDPTVRNAVEVVLSAHTGVRFSPLATRLCPDTLFPTPCDAALRSAWQDWWARNRDHYLDDTPYVHHGLRLELAWRGDRLEATLTNHGSDAIELYGVEGMAAQLLIAERSMPNLELRESGSHRVWRLTDSGVASRIEPRPGRWVWRRLDTSESMSFDIAPVLLTEIDPQSPIVLLYSQPDCDAGSWCGEIMSNAVDATPR
ncbi:MAG: hypothetical protein AAGD38_11795 [Acidobacteriota bacterium]